MTESIVFFLSTYQLYQLSTDNSFDKKYILVTFLIHSLFIIVGRHVSDNLQFSRFCEKYSVLLKICGCQTFFFGPRILCIPPPFFKVKRSSWSHPSPKGSPGTATLNFE